jgi:Tfp pilus assembly protein PilX
MDRRKRVEMGQKNQPVATPDRNSRPASGSAEGFALIASLLTVFILTAMGLLVFTVTTQDLRMSSRSVGEKKAFAAAETGLHLMMQVFNPDNLPALQVSLVPIDSTNDPQTQYSVSAASFPSNGPEALPLAGYSMGGGQTWGQNRYFAQVAGTNTRYNSNLQIDVGLGFGPIEIMTTYR